MPNLQNPSLTRSAPGRDDDTFRLLEAADLGLLEVEPNGEILWANQAYLHLVGCRAEECIGHPFRAFLAGGESAAMDLMPRLLAQEGLGNHPARLVSKQGALRDVLISSTAVVEDGEVLSSRCLVQDVTEQNRAKDAQALLAAIVDSSDDAIVTKSLDGIITSWNAGAERLFGYPAEEAIGQPILLIIPPDLHAEERSIIAKLRRGERINHYETERVTRQGERIAISITVSPVRNDEGRIIGASKIARDVTERRRVEQQLREADRRKDEFLATLSHELRNPLAPLRHSLEIIKQRPDDAGLLVELRAVMERQVSHIVRLIDDLLDLSRITHDKFDLRKAPVELAAVVRHAVDSSRAMIDEAGHHLAVELPQESLWLEADSVRLTQVLDNLLSNACKYTPPGGEIRLSARRRGGKAELSVQDTGQGIRPADLENIFEMFSQSDPTYDKAQGGLGVGLTLVKRLVEMHGGSVRAFSEGAGRGSEFLLALPLCKAPHDPADDTSAAADACEPGTRRRVLVVDDNHDSANSLATLLEIAGHETRCAFDGLQAVSAAREFRPDVILLDIGLPGIDGYEACRRIRRDASTGNVTIVAVTGWGQQQDQIDAREAGFDAHLVKPVALPALQSILDDRSEH